MRSVRQKRDGCEIVRYVVTLWKLAGTCRIIRVPTVGFGVTVEGRRLGRLAFHLDISFATRGVESETNYNSCRLRG